MKMCFPLFKKSTVYPEPESKPELKPELNRFKSCCYRPNLINDNKNVIMTKVSDTGYEDITDIPESYAIRDNRF